ncbi:MAG TPA: universal stress protein [Acidimicrobiales bacterium]|nr:universal stress protein [Acidimicrobiales bacterium]
MRGGEVILVSLEPAALRRRLAQGLVYPKERADAALSNYFQFANLAALRELAELWLDDTVPDPVTAYRAAHHIAERRAAKVVLVALDGSFADEWLIRYAADLAEVDHAELRGVHVEVADGSLRPPRAQLRADRRLLEELEGTLLEVSADDIASGLIRTASEIAGSQLVIGSPGGSRWSRLLRGFTVGRVLRTAGDIPVQVVNIGQPKTGLQRALRAGSRKRR